MAFPAFFDACALYGSTLNDVILRLADGGAFRPLWSDDVLDEVRRNVIGDGYSAEEIDHRLYAMREYFPDALVDGYHDLEDRLTCHPEGPTRSRCRSSRQCKRARDLQPQRLPAGVDRGI